MYPHRILLRGPWDAQPLAATRLRRDGSLEELPDPVPPPLKVVMPGNWRDQGLGGFSGRVRFRRGFGWPKPLAEHERLWLILESVDTFAEVNLNGKTLGRVEGPFLPAEFEITPYVEARNELRVDVDSPKADAVAAGNWLWRGRLPPGGGLPGLVALEVRREAFLRVTHLHTEWTNGAGILRLRGELAGQTGRPLDLSVRLGLQELHYGRLAKAEFDLELAAGPQAAWYPRAIGEPRLHELLLHLNEPASQIDSRAFRVGFRSARCEDGRWWMNGQPIPSPALTPWTEPLASMPTLDRADEAGGVVLLEAPVRLAEVTLPARQASATTLLERLRAGVAHHPSVLDVV